MKTLILISLLLTFAVGAWGETKCIDKEFVEFKQMKKMGIEGFLYHKVKSLESRIEALEEKVGECSIYCDHSEGIHHIKCYKWEMEEEDEERPCNRMHPIDVDCNICYELDKPKLR